MKFGSLYGELLLKVLVELFQKLAVSKGGAFGRSSKRAKFSSGLFFLLAFSLRLLSAKKKRKTVAVN